MQKITPFLWFDHQAEEAVGLYTSIFDNSRIMDTVRHGEAGSGPAGTVMTVAFQLDGQAFTALNGGPQFSFTPAISFFVSCETEAEIDALFETMSAGGMTLMPLQKYPFSEKFAWINDRYGVSWQLNLASSRQKITPFLMFVGAQHGKAEEAMNLYVSLFPNSSIGHVDRYGAGEEEPEGTVKHAKFAIDGQEFMAIDSHWEHEFTFTEAISFVVNCETQEEVDALWEKLSAGGEKGVCGWLKDRYGVSWQIIPTRLGELLTDPDPEKAQSVTEAMLQMTKIDIRALEKAYERR